MPNQPYITLQFQKCHKKHFLIKVPSPNRHSLVTTGGEIFCFRIILRAVLHKNLKMTITTFLTVRNLNK